VDPQTRTRNVYAHGRTAHSVALVATALGDTDDANAALIAAAPQLLAALEDIFKWANDNGRIFSFRADSDGGVVSRARAAIAQAKGE